MDKLLSVQFSICLYRIAVIEALKLDIIICFSFCMVTLSLSILSLLFVEGKPGGFYSSIFNKIQHLHLINI